MTELRSRRVFLKRAGCALCVLGAGGATWTLFKKATGLPEATASEHPWPHETMFYEKLDDLRIRCTLCPRKCEVADVERGYCGVRENRGGKYYSMVYGRLCSANVDPIEKKPLFHYLPGTKTLSIATAGCNIECKFCQNWQISQFRPEQVPGEDVSPEEIVALAKRSASPTIAYTYSEPVIFYETMYDSARIGREKDVGSVIITNGYINKKPMVELCKHLTGIKIDLKAFTEKFYRDVCSGELKPVLEALVTAKEQGKHLEIVVLIIPTLNDSHEEVSDMCDWIQKNLGPDVPLHFTRFHAMYKIRNLPSTPVGTLEDCRKIAQDKGINFVYVGNVLGHEGEHTYCANCKKPVIKRFGYHILENKLKDGKCGYCNAVIPGIWSQKQALAS